MRWLRHGLLLACCALPVGAALFRVWVGQDAVRIGYELSEQARLRRDLRELVRRLEIELATERSPERLQQLAVRLGMAPPGGPSVVGGVRRGGGDGHE